jgi:PERQ amino acid-rich with GYF domain-containing protein
LTPVSAGQSAWAKPAGNKASTSSGSAGKSKPTLQEILKEEESRKAKAAAEAAKAATKAVSYGTPSPALASGKRYADLAGKHTPVPNVASGNAWTTVGSGGKVKNPAVAPASPVIRTASTGITPAATPKKPVAPRSTAMVGEVGKVHAEKEFKKWALGELRTHLKKDVDREWLCTIYPCRLCTRLTLYS